jgi:hypothetical protein
VWGSFLIDAQFGVGRKAGVHLLGETCQFGFEGGSKISATLRDVERGAVVGQPRFALSPGKQLVAVVGKVLSAHDIEIAGL